MYALMVGRRRRLRNEGEVSHVIIDRVSTTATCYAVRLAGIGVLPPLLLIGAAIFSANYLMVSGYLKTAEAPTHRSPRCDLAPNF